MDSGNGISECDSGVEIVGKNRREIRLIEGVFLYRDWSGVWVTEDLKLKVEKGGGKWIAYIEGIEVCRLGSLGKAASTAILRWRGEAGEGELKVPFCLEGQGER